MNKKLLGILLVAVLGLSGCEKDNHFKDSEVLKDHGNVILTIAMGNKSCVPVELALYDDNQYELFTRYESCKPGVACNQMLKYTKSIKGKYEYNPIKIIEDDKIGINKPHSMDNLPEYEIYVGDTYVQKGYEYNYSIEKGTSNRYLEELLTQLDINLKVCAEPEYIK